MRILFVYFTELWRDYMMNTLLEELPTNTRRIKNELVCWIFGEEFDIEFIEADDNFRKRMCGVRANKVYIQGDVPIGEEFFDDVRLECQIAVGPDWDGGVEIVEEFDEIM